MVKYQKYEVTWRDHFSSEGWFDLKNPDVHKDMQLMTVGFFVAEDKNYYHFARTVGINDHPVCADMMSILKNQIVKLKVIK